MATLLELAEQGNAIELSEKLEYAVKRIHASRRGALSDSDMLVDEAFSYVRIGDLDEALLRLRCRARPKFDSVEDCQRRYDAAMAEKNVRPA